MQDFDGKDNLSKAEVVWKALREKHPEYKWYTLCHDDDCRCRQDGSYLYVT